MSLTYFINFTVAFSKSLYFCSNKKCHDLPGIFKNEHITAKSQKSEFEKYVTNGYTAFSITFFSLIQFIMDQKIGWRSVANNEIKHRMRGNMFIANQMWITFLSCFYFNVFLWECHLEKSTCDRLVTLRSVELLFWGKSASRICLARLQGYVYLKYFSKTFEL